MDTHGDAALEVVGVGLDLALLVAELDDLPGEVGELLPHHRRVDVHQLVVSSEAERKGGCVCGGGAGRVCVRVGEVCVWEGQVCEGWGEVCGG